MVVGRCNGWKEGRSRLYLKDTEDWQQVGDVGFGESDVIVMMIQEIENIGYSF